MSGGAFIPAVRLTSVYKRYSSEVILNGLNMTVRKGSIYGLLGPSGCGKTTLLSCIVGRTRIDSGEIQIIYSKRQQLGYMPQDIALYEEFTIEEAFIFYGTVFGLTKEQIDHRLRYLAKLLQLPDLQRFVKVCSGGQQRRVSMAVTLFHNPELLILDEPTVGLDPVLSHKIWDHFVELAKEEGKTIIITTHYIEEARNANCIGLMREGVLIAENNPNVLITMENVKNLEEAFLKLSKKQQNSGNTDLPEKLNLKSGESVPHRTFIQSDLFSKSKFWAQYKKNYISTRRQSILTFFLLGFPILSIFFLIIAFYEYPVTHPVGILNYESYPCNYTELAPNKCYPLPPEPLSCLFIRLLQASSYSSEVIEHSSWEEAVDSLADSKTHAFVLLNENISLYMMEKFVRRYSASKAAAENGFISVYTGSISSPIRLSVEYMIGKCFAELLDIVGDKCNWSPGFGDNPVHVEQNIYGKRFDWIGQSVARYLTIFTIFTNMVYTSSSLNTAINSGCFERDRISGLTLMEIFGAQALVQFVILTFQNIGCLFVTYVIFDITQNGSITLILLTLTLIGILGFFYGLLIGILFKDGRIVTFLSMGFALILSLLNGFIWPIEGYNWFIKPTGYFYSTFYGGTIYSNISLRGWGLTDYYVARDLFFLISHVLVSALLTYVYVKRKTEQL